MSDSLNELQAEVSAALEHFEKNRFSILEAAVKEGQKAVDAVWEEYDHLRAAHYEIINRRLNITDLAFAEAAKQASAAAKEAEAAVKSLESISKILSSIEKVVNAVGRIVLKFGIA